MKTQQMFLVHTTPEKFKNTTIANHFGCMCLRKTRSGKSNDGRDAVVFKTHSVKTFTVHTKRKSRRFPPVRRAFRKAPFS